LWKHQKKIGQAPNTSLTRGRPRETCASICEYLDKEDEGRG
jgi:hypothetical protein